MSQSQIIQLDLLCDTFVNAPLFVSGVTTIEEGLVDGQTLKLTTKDVARMSFANDVAVTKVFGLRFTISLSADFLI